MYFHNIFFSENYPLTLNNTSKSEIFATETRAVTQRVIKGHNKSHHS